MFKIWLLRASVVAVAVAQMTAKALEYWRGRRDLFPRLSRSLPSPSSRNRDLLKVAIIQVTGHAREWSLDDYDEVTEDETRQLSHIVSGHVPSSASACAQTPMPSTSTSTYAVPLVESQVHQQVAAFSHMPFFSAKQNLQAPLQIFNNCVFNNSSATSTTGEKRKGRRIIVDSHSE